ncbi:MAG: hypothetical protein AAF367_02350 [Pseudomonadota bacterium]
MTPLRPRAERGAALLIVLGGLALISALAAMALSASTAPATRAAVAIAQAQANRVAEAAAHRLIAALGRDDLRRVTPLDGTVISTQFFGADIDISGQDMGGLIDINHASEPVLERLLALTGADEAAGIAAQWTARRDRSAGRRAFTVPEDALAMLTDDQQRAARAALPHLTTWSGRDLIDPYVATAPALAAISGISLEGAQAFVAERTLTGRQVALPDAADDSALAISDAREVRLSIRATTPEGGRASLQVTVRIGRSARAPITILAWR